MREISTERIVLGEHILIDGVEYVVEGYDDCSECAFNNSKKCDSLPCCTGGSFSFTKVQKEPTYRPYKDTDEMIADWKERFMVGKISDFCMPLIWAKNKGGVVDYRRLISAFTDSCVSFGGIFMSMRELFDGYTYFDGSPCGKEIE